MSKKLTKEQSALLSQHQRIMAAMYDRINNVHKRPLHAGQIQVAKAYFNEGKRVIQSQWGRSGGKSEVVLYVAWVRALLYPNSQIYIICPERKQGKEIYWASGRLTNYGPPEYVAAFKETELRILFKNGSFICVDGCENAKAHRGVKPTLVFYDEFQEHSQEFDLEIMRPNLLAKNSALIITGTPPKRECYYTEFKRQLLRAIKDGDDSRLYLQFPTSINPSIDPAELAKTLKSLYDSSNAAIAKREYLGEDCFGGEGIVFSHWDRERLVRPHDVMQGYISRDRSKLRWVAFADPGNNTCFAVLFCAYNPNTAQFFILDEIYETDRKKTEPLSIWARIIAKQKELYDGKWINGYDSAAAWWETLIRGNFGVTLVPSAKSQRDVDSDVALMKSMMKANDVLFVSKKCAKFIWEIENFVTDNIGMYPEKDDHLIDCCRYALRYFNFKFVERGADGEVIQQRSSLYTAYGLVDNNKLDWTDSAVENSYRDISDFEWN